MLTETIVGAGMGAAEDCGNSVADGVAEGSGVKDGAGAVLGSEVAEGSSAAEGVASWAFTATGVKTTVSNSAAKRE